MESLLCNHCCGILAVETLLWNHCYESLLCNHCCGITAVESVSWIHYSGIIAVESLLWRHLGGIWEAFWRHLGGIWEASGGHLGAPQAMGVLEGKCAKTIVFYSKNEKRDRFAWEW